MISADTPGGYLICGIHAGWRGVASRIVPLTLTSLKDSHGHLSNLQIFIGPHIQQASFEVDHACMTTLLGEIPEVEHPALAFKIGPKFHINLGEIVKRQVLELHPECKEVHFENIDTVKNVSFHSFRRCREAAGRQLSFIAIKAH
jgi:copper oxidase (laccase) domain-containing protein